MGGCPTGAVPGSFQRGGRKRGLQTDLQSEIVREIETLLACQSIADLDFEAVELAARRQSLRLAARALEQRLNTDTSDHVGPQLPCSCGGSAQYHGRHGKTFESVLGPLHLQRAYGRLLRRIPVTSDPFSCRLQTTLTYRPSDSSQSWPKRQTSARSSRRAGRTVHC